LRTGVTSNPQWTNRASLLAEMGTMQLEFAFVSFLTKDAIYARKAIAVYDTLVKIMPEDKLLPVFIHPDDAKSRGMDLVSVGALGDSYYEYLLKYWLVTKKESKFGEVYFDVVESILDQMSVQITVDGEELWYIAERHNGGLMHKFDHLACFFGGLLALGAQHASSPEIKERHMTISIGIAKFCRYMYTMNPTKLPCEHVLINRDIISVPTGAGKGWFMRPEAVETWFVLYRLTNDTKYRDWGWNYYESIQKYAKKQWGYTGLRDATDLNNQDPDDVQQSYFLAETLKYLYLLFCPTDIIPLDKFMFNTEAHPISLFKSVI